MISALSAYAPISIDARHEDHRLIRLAAEGDRAAFEQLFERHRTGLRGFLYRRLHSLEDADDAVTLTFLKAWRARETYRGTASAAGCGKAWLYQIAARVALDFLRSRRRHPELELDALEPEVVEGADQAPDPADLALQEDGARQARQAVEAAVARLSAEERRLVSLFYFEERSYDEISASLGVSRSQVRGRLHRIRGRLRHDLAARQQFLAAG